MTRLLNNKLASALTVFLLCTDYVFVIGAVNGRMDMMTATFGLAGLAAYLSHREANLNRAILLSAVGAAGAVFCHPLGLIYAGIIFFTALFLDWRRIRVCHVLLAVAPFAVGGLFGPFISCRHPRSFSLR